MAAEMVAVGRTVILLDTDPQQSLMAWAGLGSGVLSQIVEAVGTTHPERFRAKVEASGKTANRVIIDTPPGFAGPALFSALPLRRSAVMLSKWLSGSVTSPSAMRSRSP